MLSVVNLTFDHGVYPLLKDVNLSLKPGDVLHVHAKNGRGKTTLFRMIAGFLQPEMGDILWHNQSIYTQLPAYQQRICYVGHKTGVSHSLSVTQHLRWENKTPSIAMQSVINTWGLHAVKDTLCARLSSGELRRVALSRLTLTKAPLWILDEPLVGLDDKAIQTLLNCIKQHREDGGMVILSSHHALPATFTDVQRFLL